MTCRFALLFITVNLSFYLGFSQTVVIPDPQFRSCLTTDYPSVMSGQELDTALAQGLGGTLQCREMNIVEVEGVQYFASITVLDFYENDIVDLRPVAGLSQLEEIIVDFNEIDTVPDLSGFSNLVKFSAHENQLDWPPLFPPSMEYMDVSRNSLSFDYDISAFTNLQYLNLSRNDIQTLPGLPSLTELEYVDLFINELSEPLDLTSMNRLKHADFAENDYEDFHLFNLDTLQFLGLGSNVLTFEDVLPFVDHPNFPDSFPDFSNQRSPGIPTSSVGFVGSSWSWMLDFDQDVSGNTYYWFQNGQPIDTTTTGVLEIVSLILADSGSYTCEVVNTSPALSGWRISSSTNQLTVEEFPELEEQDPPAFSPNGDEIDDTYVIEGGSQAAIFDKTGRLVKELALPGEWDGLSNAGEELSFGLYIIIIDGSEKRSVSLMR